MKMARLLLYFFSKRQRLAALSRLNGPLEELGKRIDFEMFCPVLTEALRKAERRKPAEKIAKRRRRPHEK